MKEKNLLLALSAKEQEIQQAFATSCGLGSVSTMDESARHRLEEDVEQLIEDSQDARRDGDSIEEWRAIGALPQRRSADC